MKIVTTFPISNFQLRFKEGIHTHPYYITAFGPFSLSSSYDNSISVNRYKKVLIICNKKNFDICKKFTQDLSEGLANEKKIFKGFNNIFGTNIDFQVVDYNSGEYNPLEICNIYVKNYEPLTFPLVILPKTLKSEIDGIYYRVKANFLDPGLSENTPSQIVTLDMLKNTSSYKWSLLPLSIQLFVKMGGVPYALAQKPLRSSDETKIKGEESLHIIGLGLSRDPLNSRNYVGYVSIFDQNGAWMFGESNIIESNVSISFGEIISRSIKNVIQKYNYQNHIFMVHYSGKELGRKEDEMIRDAISKVKEELGSRVSLFILKVNKSELIFIDNNGRYTDNSGETPWYPPVGIVTRLKERVYLLTTTGTYDTTSTIKSNITRGMPTTLLISRHAELETQNDIDLNDVALLRTVFAMSRMNYASVQNPLLNEPITIRYSREIAYITSRLYKISGKPIPDNVRKVMWFI